MTNSLELYKEVLTLAKNNPTYNCKNYYLQLLTTIFYELTTKKNSPLISLLCQTNIQNFAPKNFKLQTAQVIFNVPTTFDMYIIISGLNYAFSENLDSALKIYEPYAQNIFRGAALQETYFQDLLKSLAALDDNLGKFLNPPKSPSPFGELDFGKLFNNVSFENKQNEESLSKLSKERQAADEKILGEIKKVQLALQDELPRLQGTLKTISDIREEIDFKSAAEPTNQLIQLFDRLNETLQRHPQADAQAGYNMLIKRCKNFSRLIEQALAMLGAEFINEINIPLNPDKHEVINTSRPPAQAVVSKILRVGLIYKGQVIRKAEVEIFLGR